MIEIYRRADGKDKLIRSYDTFEHMFKDARAINVHTLADFGYDVDDRINANYLFGEHDPVLDNFDVNRNCYVCYENDKFVTPDRLVGLYRKWHSSRGWGNNRWRWGWWHHAGHKKAIWPQYSNPKTTHEIRWAHAWDDEEFAPKTGFARGRRRASALPTLWDDQYGHNDRSWKTQSKRRHQWKDKV